MASAADINVCHHDLFHYDDKAVFLTRRFDRSSQDNAAQRERIPYLSAMAMTQHRDGDEGSYLEILDAISMNSAAADADRLELFKRVAFSILISNTDDHLRNHGFLRTSSAGWTLSPAFDINPVPQDIKPRVLSTAIDYDDRTCSLELLRSVATEYGLKLQEANTIITRIAEVVAGWRQFAENRGAPRHEINRMASAFEHDDLARARHLT